MQNLLISSLILAALTLTPCQADEWFDSPLKADLQVVLSGVDSSQGVLRCSVYDREYGFPRKSEKAVQYRSVKAADRVVLTFRNLPVGDYAVSVFHDLNENGQLDRNFIGIPKESWGASNDPRPLARGPVFSEASFRLEQSGKRVEIRLE